MYHSLKRGTDMSKLLLCITCMVLFMLSYISNLRAALAKNYDINVSYQRVKPRYRSVPAETVQSFCSGLEYIPVGCTYYEMAYDFTYSYNYKIAGLKGLFRDIHIDMKIYYKDFSVYIDDRYQRNSCEYKEIKKHEDLHVKINQKVEVDRVKEELETCLSEIEARAVEKTKVDEAIKACVKTAFDLDEQIRQEKNQNLDEDKSKQPNLSSNC